MIDRGSDQFLLDAYSGKGGFNDGSYLVAHVREGTEKLNRRKALAVYPNFVRKIVNVMMGFLWRQSPSRETDDLYARFSLNADNNGSKLDTLLFSYQRLAMILGTVYVIVDKPTTQGATKASEAMPYLVLRLPGQLVHEEKDSNGKWTKVVFSEKSGSEIVYRTYTDTTWLLSKNADGSESFGGGNYFSDGRSLGRVPVVCYHIEKPLDPTDSRSQSWVYDIANLNWALFNAESEMTELFRGQTFAILAFPVVDPQERESLSNLTVGVDNALSYNPAGGGKPEFIAPPASSIELYMKKIAGIVYNIYRLANLEFIGSVQPSGEALAFHFYETNSALGGMAEQAESSELEIAQLVYAWQGQLFEGSISYPKEFNLTDLMGAISVALDSVTLGLGVEFDKALKKRLAKQILGNDTSPTVIAAIDAEIDAQGDVYGDRLAKVAK